MKISRRQALAFGAAALASRRALAQGDALVPAGFVSHGSPFLAVDPVRGPELRAWGARLPRPTGVVAITPHYRSRGVRIGHVGRGRALRSFPAAMDRMVPRDLDYPSPDNSALARIVADLLAPLDPHFDGERAGFDHTTWMPLLHLFPEAHAPVVEIAMPFMREEELLTLGRRLAPLRFQGVFVLGSGGATHNLAASDEGETPAWATAFDDWVKRTLTARDVPALLDWRARAPSADLAHPDDGGHYRALLVALGAVARESTFSSATFPVAGMEGSLSKLCVELG